ncbi:LANO_0F02938g1_1 [Lachancea nothofagi CBS 11611]|uniref:LANO_0F02938g1_1 n=1 Tax=Lachancea nothofagi CBS 11611 TaxID=1266666 RepID=A0A1G4K6X1_9SACH|nr:LANO_0F02938g1_1 [Lachancea nothofagi CBS 11611]
MLTERDVKLLSRQRGSALRKIEQDIVISQSKRPKLDRPSLPPPTLEHKEYGFDQSFAAPDLEDDVPLDVPTRSPTRSPVLNGLLTSPENLFTSPTRFPASPDRASPASLPQVPETPPQLPKSPPRVSTTPERPRLEPDFSFSDLPISQLKSNPISLASIEVISSILESLFEEQLIPQSYADFDTATDSAEQFMHKLDIKLLSTFIHGVVSDLQDTLDINISNNELCSQLKDCERRKFILSEKLLDIRQQINDWETEPGSNEQLEELRRKSVLNDKLQNLVSNLSHTPAIGEHTKVPSLERKVDDLVQLVNPNDGLLTKLQTFNDSLEKLLE